MKKLIPALLLAATSSTAQAAANCGNASREKWLHVPDMQKSRDQGRLAMPTGRE